MEYQKWSKKLLGFDFEISNKPGFENKAADGLSRSMAVSSLLLSLTVPSELQWEDFFKEIVEDKTLQDMIGKIQTGELQSTKFYVLDGKLWSKNRLVIPKNSVFQSSILHEAHDSTLGGHSGVLKTLKRVQCSFFWSGMSKKIQDYVAECIICQTHKHSTFITCRTITTSLCSGTRMG